MRDATPVNSVSDAPVESVDSGMPPAMPARKLPSPLVVTVFCTERKSTALRRRHETFWIARLPLMACIVVTSVTKANAGSSPQNAGPKSRSSPGQRGAETESQAASATRAPS